MSALLRNLLVLALGLAASSAALAEETRYTGPHADVVARLLADARARGVTYKFPSCPTCTDFVAPAIPTGMNQRETLMAVALQKAFLIEFYARFDLSENAPPLVEALMNDISMAGGLQSSGPSVIPAPVRVATPAPAAAEPPKSTTEKSDCEGCVTGAR